MTALYNICVIMLWYTAFNNTIGLPTVLPREEKTDMNKKDLASIRRRFSPDKNDISIIRGCFVNEKGGIVSTFSKSPISLPASEAEHYLASFKKTLGGAVGRNQFTLPVHTDDAALLHQLQTTELKDEAAVTALFNTIREKMEFDGSYLILAMHDAYSIPYRKSDEHTDRPDFTDKVFNYIMVSICPVKLTKPLLTFFSDDRDFHTVEPDLAVGGPALGFMYPIFSDGGADINAALYYTKDASDLHADFIDAVFHTTAPEAASDKREQFYGVLGDSLEKGLTFDVVQTIHENLVAQAAEKKKGENLQVGRKEIASLLDSCDVDAAEQKAFDEGYLEQFGAVGLDASLIADQKRFEIETENVKINVDPERSDLVEVKRVDGRRMITIWVEGDITVNGIEVDV